MLELISEEKESWLEERQSGVGTSVLEEASEMLAGSPVGDKRAQNPCR